MVKKVIRAYKRHKSIETMHRGLGSAIDCLSLPIPSLECVESRLNWNNDTVIHILVPKAEHVSSKMIDFCEHCR